ncbi:MAG TPA: ABC transporter permease subunit [Candidatus Limnocylindrales bacterium]|jgi:putative spermidine/putrescine transport system permease protein|nr:ABC transporter permease subunit [Candidatus Limnocylindrales bacterium]
MSSVGGGTPITGDATMRQALSQSATVPRRRRSLGTIVWWVIFLAGVAYFVIPLWSTFMFSLQAEPFGAAYTNTLDDPQFGSTLLYSFVVGVITVIVSIAIMVPTAFWVRLRVPRLRRIVEFVTLLPFVIPPVLLVFGLIRSYSSGPLPLTNTDIGSSALLVAAYTVLSFPYMYRAVDVGLRSIDVQSLTEASQSLGAGWFRILWSVILPNLRVSLLAGAFLTLAIVIGEYTIATFLARPAFGPYLALIGGNKAYEPAAVSLISFALTWAAMGVIQYIGRGTRISVAGAR